jgi:Flp pilus assembly protein TadG
MKHHSIARRPRHRRGAITLEGILVLPPLLILVVAVLEFGIAMQVLQAVTVASVEGARAAARQNATRDSVAIRVSEFLDVHGIVFSTVGPNSVDSVRVVIEGPVSVAGEWGNSTIPCTANGAATLPGNQVRVTVCIKMTDSSDRPVPDWLSSFGFTTASRQIEVSSIAIVE